jgi:hypothetical protein
MNAATITALIAALTAFVGAVSGLVALIVHIVNHDPIPPVKAPDLPVNSTPKTITKPPTL